MLPDDVPTYDQEPRAPKGAQPRGSSIVTEARAFELPAILTTMTMSSVSHEMDEHRAEMLS